MIYVDYMSMVMNHLKSNNFCTIYKDEFNTWKL